jgi:GNAT superfamily N-acetyltransferase
MEVAFETLRLRVFKATIVPNDCSCEKEIFLGFLLGDERPAPVVTATLCPPLNGFDAFLEWAETVSDYRRHGLATELLLAVDKQCYSFNYNGATEDGDAFCEHLEKASTPSA